MEKVAKVDIIIKYKYDDKGRGECWMSRECGQRDRTTGAGRVSLETSVSLLRP